MSKDSLKRTLSKSKVLKVLWHFCKWLFVEVIFETIMMIFPVKKNKIVACNFYGSQYGDNPKYIVDELLKLDESHELDIVWVLDKRKVSKRELPKYVRDVEYGTLRYFYELSTAKVWIDNARKMLVPRKKRSQFYVQTWHGSIGVKKVEKDANMPREYNRRARKDSKYADIFLSGNKFTTQLYRDAYWYNGEIMEYGSPKFDKIMNRIGDAVYEKKIKEKVLGSLGIKEGTKTVLYAPTFREKGDDNCYDIDYQRLRNILEEKYNGSWAILLRFHPNISGRNMNRQWGDGVYDVTKYPDLYEILPICDMVITDYSSVGFEAAIINKPVFIYASDYEEYKKDERGFYLDLKDLPFPFAEDNDALIKNIIKYDISDSKKINQKIMKIFGVNETGKSAKMIAKRIFETVDIADQNDKL